MMTLFCPKCGAGEQSHESYCRSCGEWLPNLEHIGGLGLFRAASREDRVQRIRVLELISIGMSLTSALIVFLFLTGLLDRNLLYLVVAFGIVVSVYQIANMYLGRKVAKSLPKKPETEDRSELSMPGAPTKRLSSPAEVSADEMKAESGVRDERGKGKLT